MNDRKINFPPPSRTPVLGGITYILDSNTIEWNFKNNGELEANLKSSNEAEETLIPIFEEGNLGSADNFTANFVKGTSNIRLDAFSRDVNIPTDETQIEFILELPNDFKPSKPFINSFQFIGGAFISQFFSGSNVIQTVILSTVPNTYNLKIEIGLTDPAISDFSTTMFISGSYKI